MRHVTSLPIPEVRSVAVAMDDQVYRITTYTRLRGHALSVLASIAVRPIVATCNTMLDDQESFVYMCDEVVEFLAMTITHGMDASAWRDMCRAQGLDEPADAASWLRGEVQEVIQDMCEQIYDTVAIRSATRPSAGVKP